MSVVFETAVPAPMMRSLTLKLALAFLGVGLIGALLMALFVGRLVQRAFDQFVVDRGRTALIRDLTRYYESHGTWEGVAQVLDRDQPGPPEHHPPVVLTNSEGQVVMGSGRYRAGSFPPMQGRFNRIPIDVNGHTVGWLLNDSGWRQPEFAALETAFLRRITGAITYSAIGATAIALLLGIVLARTLTHPLRELTAATRAVAKGDLGRQVPVRSQDELGALAVSFNQMSKDLEHASTLRRQMTADIAHDLRTPLSVILGYTEALREGKLEGTPEIFETMHIEAEHLRRLIDDLRTLSLADAGELILTRQPVAPMALLERAAMAYKAQADAQHIALVVKPATALPEVEVDPERIAQVLGNLLSNALRYTPADGTITLSTESNTTTVSLHVADTGCGIREADLPHIFERFYRADPSRQQEGASGLGLAIAKSLVEAHHGTISVESTYGKGTTFTIALPRYRPAASAPATRRR